MFEQVCIVGCGDLGTRLAHLWHVSSKMDCVAVVRSLESCDLLNDQGIHAINYDLSIAQTRFPFDLTNNLLYYFVPPPKSGVEDEHCRHFLAALDRSMLSGKRPKRIVAISTSGVYGDRGGDLVCEEDLPNPQVDRARRRLHMEQQLKLWCNENNVDLIVLRVGGIYGPNRLPLKRIRSGTPMIHLELSPTTNRIHVDDLAQVCAAAARVDFNYRVYNVSDGVESSMTEYFFAIADYYNLPRPRTVDWEDAQELLSAGMLSYLKESRRLDVSRLKSEMGVSLLYPDLLSGLESFVQTV